MIHAGSLHTIFFIGFVGDRQVMTVERRILTEGWKSVNFAAFADMDRPVRTKEKSVVISYRPEAKVRCLQDHS